MIMLRFLIYYAIPLTIIGIFYALIARHLIRSVHNVPGEMQGAHRQVRARRKVAATVLAFVVIFALCFFPYHLFMLWFYFDPNAKLDYNAYWHAIRIIGFCLSFLNSCVNPVALYCVSGTFRKYFNRYLLCRGRLRVTSRCGTTSTYRRANSMSLTTSRMIHQNSSIHGGGCTGGSLYVGGNNSRRKITGDGKHHNMLMSMTGLGGKNNIEDVNNGSNAASIKHHHHRNHYHHHHHHRHYHYSSHRNTENGDITTGGQETSVILLTTSAPASTVALNGASVATNSIATTTSNI